MLLGHQAHSQQHYDCSSCYRITAGLLAVSLPLAVEAHRDSVQPVDLTSVGVRRGSVASVDSISDDSR